ncbi:T9SS type A sorting domain-containing protein [Dyadobacter frigoris]|uniref:Probable pectate lyase C n=1 Tax=Dyadobacter frigoris TaxID=2576211 RepID=A0A4U6D009_9BACT|nr:T9SS type A sorting domain-containing protein [Dyadobacter frigoris]TKT87054.1 T9SS type A sorting domain-containing protein [Dyadobacter frigoris]
MKKFRVIGMLFAIVFSQQIIAQITPANGIVYVKKGSAGNGSSWADAAGELADALVAAKSNSAILQIWVAGGIYKPIYSAIDLDFGTNNTIASYRKNNAFLMVNNLKIYGGFAGNENTLAERNLSLAVNKCTLSGDIDNDNSISAGDVYHVVISAGNVGTAELNGFTISGGRAFDFYYNQGQFSYGAYNIINGRKVMVDYGGGMSTAASSPRLTNVIISANKANYGSGMFNDASSSPILTNVIISTNIAYYGGGMFNFSSSSPVLTNVTIVDNLSDGPGGGMFNSLSSPKINNSIIYNNRTGNNVDNGVKNLDLAPVYKNSLVQDNPAGANMVIYAGDANSIFTSVSSNAFYQLAGDYTLTAGSPAIHAGSNAFYAAGQSPDLSAIKTDLAGNQRIKGSVDLGAYESPYVIVLPDANGIVYVRQHGAGNAKGGSWANASAELADVLVAAKTNKAITQIWVAGGVFKPLYSPADNNFGNPDGRNNTFSLVSYIMVYGGFAGTETTLDQRDLTLAANMSILSGDFNGDDVVTGSGATLSFSGNTENAYHVVVSVADEGSAELNGFTITGGNANLASSIIVNGRNVSSGIGGGMANVYSGSSAANLIIKDNSAILGGGMTNSNSYPILYNLILNNNYAVSHGGGMADNSSQSVLNNLFISGNNSSGDGGGIFCSFSGPWLNNSTISGNVAASGGSELHLVDGSVRIHNSIIIGSGENAVGLEYDATVEASYSLMDGQRFSNNIDASKYTPGQIFTNPGLGDYTLKAGSVALNAGSDALYAPYSGSISADKDIAGNPRLVGSSIDMGAFEAPQSVLPVTLISFTASLQGENNVLLRWSTASELNNEGFELEILRTDNTYQKIGFIKGSGTTSTDHHYQTVVTDLAPGMYYFRLKIIDTDQSFTYSRLRSVKVTNGVALTAKMYPNPLAGRHVYLEMVGQPINNASVKIANSLGQAVKSADYKNITGPLEIEMPAAAGTYYIEVTTENAETFVRKIVKF